jgi:hypothetical protein
LFFLGDWILKFIRDETLMMGVSFGEVALCLMTTLKVRCFDLSLKDAFLVR